MIQELRQSIKNEITQIGGRMALKIALFCFCFCVGVILENECSWSITRTAFIWGFVGGFFLFCRKILNTDELWK